jgi:hypothetical protein
MNIVRGTLMVQCESCQRQHDIHPENAAFQTSYTKKRGEGEETGYAWETVIDCGCGNSIGIDYKAWEFPTGDFNADDLKVNGAHVVKKFEFDFERETDMIE